MRLAAGWALLIGGMLIAPSPVPVGLVMAAVGAASCATSWELPGTLSPVTETESLAASPVTMPRRTTSSA